MDRTEALGQLPRVHALALRLADLGASPALLADCLGIEPEAVGPILDIAAAKLAHAEPPTVPSTEGRQE